MSAKKQTAKTEDTMTTTASDGPAAEWVDLDRLHGWDKNPKKHPDAQVRDLMRSIKRFGWGAVILAQPDGEVIAGHGRMEAAKRLGMPKVPVRWMKLDPAEAHLLALADNRLTEIGEWDDATVRQILEAAKAEGADIGGLGWTDEEMRLILSGQAVSHTPSSIDGEREEEQEQQADAGAADEKYTRKIKAPIYEIKGAKPKTSDLFDGEKTASLLAEIDQAKLPDDVAEFLRQAARRHTRFHFARIAEFYAHASPEVQRLMERSALVIVDFDAAIEHGFVSLTKELLSIAQQEIDDAG